jgi:hypothetical protein
MKRLEKLTVAELKQLLEEQGLVISGKKSELIDRLMANKEKEISELVEDSNQQLSFLKPLFQNGLSSIDFERRLTIRYGAAVPCYFGNY